jgi:general secretion pathway protein B
MSLILDALRKMELERKAKRGGTDDIRPEVLRYRGTPQKPAQNRLVPIAITVLLLVAVITAGLLLKGCKSAPQPQPTEPAAKTDVAPEVRPVYVPAPPIQPPQAPTVSSQAVPAVTQPPHPSMKTEAIEPHAASPEPAAASNITISGIAWQDERNMRRAVINGVLVGEGAEIAGARIVEIKENRVKFSRGGQTFEVIYASAFSR